MRSFWVPDAICARSLLVVRHYRMYVRIGISVMLMQRLYSAVELSMPSISSFAGTATCRNWRVNSSASAHFAVGPRAGMFWIRGLPNDITTTTAVQKLAESPPCPFRAPWCPTSFWLAGNAVPLAETSFVPPLTFHIDASLVALATASGVVLSSPQSPILSPAWRVSPRPETSMSRPLGAIAWLASTSPVHSACRCNLSSMAGIWRVGSPLANARTGIW
jgi:hypothetical protein